MNCGIFRKVILSLGILFAVTPGVKAEFDSSGNVSLKLGDDLFLNKDEVFLLEKDVKNAIDQIDWRARGTVSPEDGTVTRKGINGLLQVITSIEKIPDGAKITWICSMPEVKAEQKRIELLVQIPAEAMSFIPQQKPRSITEFSAAKQGSIEGERYLYHFDVSESDAPLKQAAIEDFRAAEWSKKFRFTVRTDYFSQSTVKIVLSITKTVNEKGSPKGESPEK